MELLAVLLVSLGLAVPQSHAPQPSAFNRVCFNKQLWSARDELRPCVLITELDEDGSFEATVTNARGDARYRVRIGNRAD